MLDFSESETHRCRCTESCLYESWMTMSHNSCFELTTMYCDCFLYCFVSGCDSVIDRSLPQPLAPITGRLFLRCVTQLFSHCSHPRWVDSRFPVPKFTLGVLMESRGGHDESTLPKAPHKLLVNVLFFFFLRDLSLSRCNLLTVLIVFLSYFKNHLSIQVFFSRTQSLN